ncbi:TPA: Crp/Fnr family transcriptional regulator [Listeria innocua]|uniref:Crp/Fnr family transcriptional regulator n=1 Tax=Listeria innocua TaxID=1642 RepID=UPI0005F071F7|nr:Crp/Fnr family transcriptional regulator [Listeria innocua]EAD5709789.1 Crp/Fnr family transcriptional regulator [Listeria innocua]EAE2481638.1 Crp/Fnr family transcriptional regulator [Listeria innocua]EAF5008951.1 Crp/Fnr family transcriptional regulator [Listeria innocua]EAG8524089.1 Crp/Fnr family transcriptional regulator [Listeria innocua]EAH4436872.1 Crp/Fnr family transcriptional regulator [Listeria innocua]
MEELFTYKEFINMMQKHGIKHRKRKFKHGEKITSDSSKLDSVILLIDGYISSYTRESPQKLLSIFEPGIFLRYCILEESPPTTEHIVLSETCEIYEYKKQDVEYALTLFPENFGFQYFFLKRFERHLFYRSLLNNKAHKDKLYYAIKYLGELIGSKDAQGNITLPSEITLKALIEYSTLSKAAFYRQRVSLLEKNILKRNRKTFIVQDGIMAELL